MTLSPSSLMPRAASATFTATAHAARFRSWNQPQRQSCHRQSPLPPAPGPTEPGAAREHDAATGWTSDDQHPLYLALITDVDTATDWLRAGQALSATMPIPAPMPTRSVANGQDFDTAAGPTSAAWIDGDSLLHERPALSTMDDPCDESPLALRFGTPSWACAVHVVRHLLVSPV
jgi:hypothetical protein